MVYTENVEFEWDTVKAISNWLKHGVPFETALLAFDDPFAKYEIDEKHSTDVEVREKLIGMTADYLLVVIFTVRDSCKIRIISARKANTREKNKYEKEKN